jgi:hypothetical protein
MFTRGHGKRNSPVGLKKKHKSPAKKQKSPEKPKFSEDSSVGGDFSSGSDSDGDRIFHCGGSESESASEYAKSNDEADISGKKGLYYNFYTGTQNIL